MRPDLQAMASALADGAAAAPPWSLAAAGLVAVAVVSLLFLGRPRRAAGPATPRPEKAGAGSARVWTVRTLAEGGIDPTEVARRTGMAREAVQLALRTGGSAGPRAA